MVNCDHHHHYSSSFSKAICSICHKDLDPFADDLQAIFICGHVFHEFCLQESFGFFESVKRYTCPVCKQRCSPSDVARLYFESVGVSRKAPPSLTPSPPIGEDAEALRQEVKELKEELYLCKEQAKKEVVNLKNEALKQQASIRQMLHMKTEVLDKLTLECLRQQERNRGLTKELAAFKLASDLDLDEKEVPNLAALGNGGSNEDTIAILRKSLVLSNRNHKELMAQCNLLERAEARHHKKLEKAKGKINRLNTKVQKLTDQCSLLKRDEAHYSRKLEKAKGKINKLKTKIQELKDQCNLLELDEARYNRKLEKAKGKINKLKARVQETDGAVEVKKETSVLGASDLFESVVPVSGSCDDAAIAPADNIADVPILDDVKQVQSTVNITKESPVIQPLARPDATILEDLKQVQPMLNSSKESLITQPLPQPVSAYFCGGLIGPDGTKRFLGKWCKRREDNRLVTTKDSSIDASCSIVVVSDEEDITENLPRIKRFKYEDSSKIVQSQGCLQYNTSLEGFVTNQGFRGAPSIDLQD
ncbi:PREDICTED: uncharacterized protein LOC101309683 [Fragaria vesca subsp. vesca]|uniref:uncharacterized protein LOC101309683 n=1 Tax=Fragaria vesca subsp. vesca TaxID=101020 RepID=UPI0002C327A7|nr:PREDICTED: uncharacterized protein LOC101309683 [Fragaria vesca subsp. vesca]